jgi:hypothetical protein
MVPELMVRVVPFATVTFPVSTTDPVQVASLLTVVSAANAGVSMTLSEASSNKETNVED